MNQFLSVLGFWGPYLLIISTSFALIIYDYEYLKIYLFFSVVGTILNSILKSIIRQPRPKNQRHLYNFEHNQTHGQEFGMPSGHAQNVFYSLFTVLFKIPNIYFMLSTLLVACNTCWQRWVYRNHTIFQIIMGSITGIIVFCIANEVSKFNLHSTIQL